MGRSGGAFLRAHVRIGALVVAALAAVALCAAVSLGLQSAYAAPEDGNGTTATVTTNGDGDIATTSPDDVPDEVLAKLAAQGIYPGIKSEVGGKETWTALDGADDDSSDVRATVTLPANKHAAADHYLFVRRVSEGEGYCPTEDAITAVAGETNDWQCYAIHWVHIWKEDGEWKYETQTDSVLGEDAVATVKIDYLNEDAYLVGHQAERKLQVYNSREVDGSALEENATPLDVAATVDAYTGFTFETNRGGPYVFVSKKLYEGYVSSLAISKTIDGVAPFDGDDAAGNDSSDSNKIVRSYDTIQYDLTLNAAARSNTSTAQEAEIGFEMTIPVGITEAAFDTDQMLWLGSAYVIDYLDQAGNVVATQKPDGTYVDAQGKTVSINDLACGSDRGESSYTSSIVTQRLTGTVEVRDDRNILAGNQTFKAFVQVLGAKNTSTIQPTFKAWFVGNEDNYGSESGNGDSIELAKRETGNEVKAEAVTVSAAARFNLEIAKNANVSYKTWFDSDRGNEVEAVSSYTVDGTSVTGAQLYQLLEALGNLEENVNKSNPQDFTDSGNACASYLNGKSLKDYSGVFGNIRYGRITGYGIGLQLYNDVSVRDSKGFKGVSLPQGAIDFDLDLRTAISGVSGTIAEDQYYAQLWEYNENVSENTGNQGKQLYWSFLGSTKYAAWAMPYNSGTGASSCYNGGRWSLEDAQGTHFTVSGYDFNFLAMGLSFPTTKAGNGSATHGYNTFIGTFSAGYVQVLNVMPRCQGGTLSLETVVTVKNLTATTTAGDTISAVSGDDTGYAHETNPSDTDDNVVNDSIPLYARGGMTKANAFDTAALYDDEGNFTSDKFYLGTYFWGTSYDCSAYAGQDITVVGAMRIGAGDYKIRHANMLQLFDSEALSLNLDKGDPKVLCHVTGANEGDTYFLYAADPKYPDGYDTNKEGVLDYMNKVREEDLRYFTSLGALEAAGYTCVGVMAELRNWSIPGEGGYNTSLLIPMTVSQDERFLGETIATVNSIRIWTNAEDMEGGAVTWANGTFDEATGTSSVEGYTPISSSTDEHYCGEVANNLDDKRYQKTEYENGQVKLGSNTGGYVCGSSLLILGYKSTVDIAVDNGGEGALPTYDLDQGNYTVGYHVGGIQARTEDSAGNAQSTQTNLTILSKLETARKEGDTAQRISVAADSYRMVPASQYMVFVDEQGNMLETQSVDIGSDPNNPTTVRYTFIDEDTGEIDRSKVYEVGVYAQRDTNGGSVTFEILGATVDVAVPDITFDALIDSSAAQNNDRIEASAYISGTSDVRAYAKTNGNMDSVTVGIIQLTATRLVKAVNVNYIELGGAFTYSVVYTNSGSEPVNVYLYDLLPENDDIRGSHYGGEAVLRKVSASLSGGEEFTASIKFYYSTLPYEKLYELVCVFGDTGSGRDTKAIQEMLANPEYFSPLGTISSENDHTFQIDESLEKLSPAELTKQMREMTGIYAVVSNLSNNRTLTMELTMEGAENSTGDLYRNIANSWLGDSSEPLTSNMVSTAVLSRSIEGVVWEDADLDGVRDEGEPLVRNVACTLFEWDDAAGQYVPCTKDVTGAPIVSVTTDDSGAYSFERLAAGKYVVAFSGDGLSGYKGATTYRVNGEDDGTSNDAVALAATDSVLDTQAEALPGIDGASYAYVIAYDLTESGGDAATYTAEAAPLHTIDDIVAGNITLTNNVELYANLDCGLVKDAGFELPETGGAGVQWLYLVGGVLLCGGACGLAIYRNRRTACAAGAAKGKVRK